MALAAYVAGLLAGFHGATTIAIVVGGTAVGGALLARSSIHASLGLLLASGALTARATAEREESCRAALSRRHGWIVEVDESAAPGGFVRARSVGNGCALPVRLAVDRGRAPAGALAVAVGRPTVSTFGLTVGGTTLRVIRPPSLLRRLRTRAGVVIDRTFAADAPLAKALLIADTKSLSPEVRDRFATSGLVHMLSISGLHVGLIAVALSLCAQVLRLPHDVGRVAALAVLAVYVAMIGAPAPAVRAAVMVAALVLARLAQRPLSPWGVLTLGAAAPLATPATVTDLGYQLSVVGVVALIAGDNLARRYIPDDTPRWRRAVIAGLLASTVATLVSLPLIAWTFGRVSVVAPLTNLIAAPLMALAQPMLFLALVLGAWQPVARFVADAAHPLLAAFDAIATAGAGLPFAALELSPTFAAAIVGGVAVTAFVIAASSRHAGRSLVVGMVCIAALAWLPSLPTAPRDAELHVIDVGQGDAIAFRTSRGRWILVDAGRAWRGGDAGRSTVVPYLRRRGGELVAFILTHPHADHAGGAATIVRALRPSVYYDAAFAGGGDAYRASLTAARQDTRWRRVRPGDSLQVDDATVVFLAPDSVWTTRLSDPNEASTVVTIRVGTVRFLLTGDAERGEEGWLLDHVRDRLRADVLKVAHHGSATSSTSAFLDAVRPRIALISVGGGNLYGHPDPSTLDALARVGAQVLRTDRLGSIVVRTDGERLRVLAGGDAWEVDRPSSQR